MPIPEIAVVDQCADGSRQSGASSRLLVVIVDGQCVAEWQRRALESLPPDDRIILLSCTNTRIPRLWRRHPLYYALNLVSVRNPLTRQVPIGELAAQVIRRHAFAAEQDGSWQRLPADIVALIAGAQPLAVIKLGMTLLRVPTGLDVPILSWHHGDPEAYRGRPAGFWEMVHRRRTIGQIIQIIGDRLDAGAIVASAETRVTPHSWRATLIEAFRHSPLLLQEALRNVAAGRTLAKRSEGRNYRLPSNRAVARLSLDMAGQAVRRALYGALMEKRWQVSTAPVGDAAHALAIACGQRPFPDPVLWSTLACPSTHSFLADPFFTENGDLLVEALANASGKGELMLLAAGRPVRVSASAGHHSYPASVEQDGKHYVVPEIANWSAPRIYRLEGQALVEAGALEIAGDPRVSDPTFLRHGGRLWLFGNDIALGTNALCLWHADGIFGRFTPHPLNPVRISPRGSRMGGTFLLGTDGPVRLGQNFTDGYGDGLFAFAIETLDPDAYREREIGSLRLDGVHGPHTFNLSPDGRKIVFDWYRDRFSAMAAVRRIRNRRR